MIRFSVILAILVALVFTQSADAELREFKTPDGKSVKAEIVGYNARVGQVELKRDNGKRVKVKPSIFVKADQQYIKDWSSLENFRNASGFKVGCKKNRMESWKEEDDFVQKKFERYVFEVELENRNDVVLDNLTVEYRIFYEQEENERGGKKFNTEKVIPGKLDIVRMEAKETRRLNTNPVVIYETDFNLTDYYVPGGDPQSAGGDIKGIWIKLTTKTPQGLSSSRDIYEPSSIEGKYTWND